VNQNTRFRASPNRSKSEKLTYGHGGVAGAPQIAADALTSKRCAAARVDVPAATHRTIRPRRSWDNGAVIVSSIARARSRAPWPKVHGLTVLTNNLRHFEPTGVPVLDPLDALPPDVLPSGSLHPAPDQNGFQVGSGVNLR